MSSVNLDSLLIGENASYIDELYVQWQVDPASVSEEWQALFASWDKEEESCQTPIFPKRSIFSSGGVDQSQATAIADRQAKVAQLINAYRVRGHTESMIDPLGRRLIEQHPELTLSYYGLTEADLDVPVSGHGVYGVPHVTTAREIISRLRKAYCSGFGVEFMNINDPKKKKWLQERLETLPDHCVLSKAEQQHMLRNLADAENFERFLHQRYQYTKRFSLEGAEPLIPLLAVLIDTIGDSGAERVMLGMAHRGRLNVLANICNKPVQYILNEFDDEVLEAFDISGDVKYHLGYSNDYQTVNGKKVRVTMAFNPSHLEAVNPVVLGRSRARQDRLVSADGYSQDAAMRAVVPMLLHGDAAFAGQGVVTEVLNMSGLEGYQTGGTIHVVVNNQIGFTTSPIDARSTPYCTDVARMLAVPIFHVNGEDIEAVAAVAKLAAEWRQTFHQDVFIDMYCFRKWGHNEGDEPSFTQPLLYDAIRKHPSAKEQYCTKIIASGTMTQNEVDSIVSDSADRLQKCLEDDLSFETYTSAGSTELKHRWADIDQDCTDVATTVEPARLHDVLTTVNTIPSSVKIHRKVQRIIAQRLEMVNGNLPVDWALAEQAAYATLVQDGYRVRISGQDVGRGTFSHRHAVLTDITTGAEYLPIANLAPSREGEQDELVKASPAARVVASELGVDLRFVQGTGRNGRITSQDVRDALEGGAKTAAFEVHNSLLSEYAVLGFEHGYTLDFPEGLVIWEAQFGDFANGAQIMIDNFIMATEQKWNRYSGLVMLLPHGYEGQGPEHSSARLERFLQLCAEDNVVVANVTTPANFFHLMRRQMLRTVRKPLVVMSPKSLLRHPKCISSLEDLSSGGFEKMLHDPMQLQDDFDSSKVEHVVFCSGKIYYDLLEHREMIERYQSATEETDKEVVRTYFKKFASFDILNRLEKGEQIETKHLVITRLEQLYPFPEAEILAHLQRFNQPTLHWCQEEPKNMGAWPMVDEWFCDTLDSRVMKYIGRKRSASPATGSPKIHKAEQASIVQGVFSLI